MGAERKGRLLLSLERVLLLAGIASLAYYGYVSVEAHRVQREFEQIPVEAAAWPPGVIGKLEIPRLKIASVVMSGEGDDVLDVAVGHLQDTPAPWEPGNSVFAAHRDGLFRPLENIRPGDEVLVRSPKGDLFYRVKGTRIVRPTDLSVLAATPVDSLTLVTCYPFNYVGSAPKRFIVRAERVGRDDELRTKN
jgi:sortase A